MSQGRQLPPIRGYISPIHSSYSTNTYWINAQIHYSTFTKVGINVFEMFSLFNDMYPFGSPFVLTYLIIEL